MRRGSFLYRYIPVGLTLCLGVGLSIVASLIVGKWERSSNQIQFQRRIDNLTTSLQRSINRYTEVLLAIGDFYDASQLEVERLDFQLFVKRALSSYPGIQALEWAPRVFNRERLTYEQSMQAEGFFDFQITETSQLGTLVRAKERQEYFPVTYISPWEGNEVAFGFDLASDTARLLALEKARDTGEIIATERIKLVQEKKNQLGFLVFLPIYNKFQSQSLPTRRNDLQGFVLGVFRVSNVVEESLEELNYDINFYIYDQSASSDKQFLGFYDSKTKQVIASPINNIESSVSKSSLCPEPATCTRTLLIGGRQWSILFLPATTYTSNNMTWGAVATLVIGLLLTGSLFLYLSTSMAELERTRELSELKLRFFSMASHEFRTPLSIILVSAQSLETHSNELSNEQKSKNLQRIQSATKRMTQLLSDILTITRAEAGKLEFNPELFNLEQFCCQIAEEIQLTIRTAQRINFTSYGECIKAYLDRKLLRFILTNLLSNAINYSPSGGQINFLLICDSKEAKFQISDQGIGIAIDDQQHLYETFYRGKNVGNTTGTGLGLAVVKTCVDLHGGQIAVNSEIGVGTTFTVILPLIS